MDAHLVKKKKLGQLLMAGFEGTKVTDNIRTLIETYHISTIILSSKNFENLQQTKNLIRELQLIARASGYEHPIMFAIDQEGGMVSSLFDENYITQFPGLMGLALTASPELVYDVCKAMGTELRSIGFSINLGPVLDVVTQFSHQLIGVRSFGSTVEEVIKYGSLLLRGFKDAGIFNFGKHFPGLNNAEISSVLELPMLTETLEQVESSNVLTFKALIDMGLLDGLEASGALVPNISPDEFHACLSTVLIDDLLRQKLNFDGVVVSECLEMEALFFNIGFKQGVIMAIFARCDLILVCHDFTLQQELINALLQAIEDGVLDEEMIDESLRRIRTLQKKLPTWEQTFNIPDISETVRAQHQDLSQLAYKKSITLVRDYHGCLPIKKFFKDEDLLLENNSLLLLTPIITPLYSKSNTKYSKTRNFPGEEVFQEFGKTLSSFKTDDTNFKVFHTSYTANGLTNLHEELIQKCKAVILITSETSRNLHQIGIAKHISILCGGSNHKAPTKKPLIIVAISSPYDFYYNKNIGSTYICTYDYTDNALENLAKVLMGEYKPIGSIPGETHKRKQDDNDYLNKKRKRDNPQRRWLVDDFNLQRDWKGLVLLCANGLFTQKEHGVDSDEEANKETFELIEKQAGEKNFNRFFSKFFHLLHEGTGTQKHFVVRNSSMNTLYGFIATWYSERLKTGSIIYLVVDATKRGQAIGESLHSKATKYLIKERGAEKITLGSPFPLIVFPTRNFFSILQDIEDGEEDIDSSKLTNNSLFSFLAEKQIWTFDKFRKSKEILSQVNYILKLDDLQNWSVSKKLVRQLQVVGIMFDICQNLDEVLQLVQTYHSSNPALYDLYAETARSDPAQVKVLVLLEPTNKSVVGSIIVFTNESSISRFYPFIDSFSSKIGGLSGLMIDPSYENLTDVFKLGLVCTSLSYLKRLDENLNGCILIGISKAHNNINNFRDNGFTIYRQYYDYYDEKDKWL